MKYKKKKEQEATELETMAAAKETSMDTSVTAILSNLDGIFIMNKNQHWRVFSVDNMFSLWLEWLMLPFAPSDSLELLLPG